MSQKYQTALCLKRPNITTRCLSSHQAQSRVQESTQKLDLLRLSLEKCLKENNQELVQQPAGGVNPAERPLSPHSSRPGCLLSTSPSILSIRPASLTGALQLVLFRNISDEKKWIFCITYFHKLKKLCLGVSSEEKSPLLRIIWFK